MSLENLAESIEKSRFELMRGQRWADLRASERETRVDLARRALEESGATAELDELRRQAARVPDLEALVTRREDRVAALEAELAADRTAHAERVAALEAQLAATRRERDRTAARAAATEAVVDAVRTLVTAPIEVAADDDGAQAEQDAPVASVPTPATDGSAHQRRPIFRMARSAPAT